MTTASHSDDLNWKLIANSGALNSLRTSQGTVVILERLPRAAGATSWFVCDNEDELKLVVNEFRPGSSVSFYFDGRIARAVYNSEVRSVLLGIIDRTGDVLIGEFHPDDVHLEMEVISDPSELDEFLATLGNATQIYFGPFPARENDGHAAVTLTLPDEDGVVRDHPH
jgi:hypothetical protein